MVDLADGEEDAGRHTALTGTTGDRRDHVGGGHLGVGVGNHHQVVLGAAEGADPFVVGRAPRVDGLGDPGRADKGDRRDSGVVADRLDHLAVAVDHREDARRQTGLGEQTGQLEGAERRLLRGLEDEGVAAADGHRGHPQRHHQREVEGGDAGHHAEREADGPAVDAPADLETFAGHQLRQAARELDALDGTQDAAFGLGPGLAVFLGDPGGQAIDLGLHQRLHPEEHLDPVLDRGRAPLALGLGGLGDGQVEVRGGGQRHLGDDVAGRRVGDLQAPHRAAVDRCPADEVGEADGGYLRSAHSWPPGTPAKLRGSHCPRPSVPTTL